MKKYLIINPFGIGDVLFTIPVVNAIKEADPSALVGYWCNQRVSEMIKYLPFVSKIFALSRGDIKKISRESRTRGFYLFFNLLRQIRKERFDLAMDFSLDQRYSLFSKIMGIRRRIGFNYKRRGRFLTDSITLDGYNNKHVVEYYLGLLAPLNIQPKDFSYSLSLPEENKIKGKALLQRMGAKSGQLLVGIAPGAGASWGKDAAFKHWPPVKFAQLADKIIKNFQAKVVILGDEKEKFIADIIMNTVKDNVIDLVGKTNLQDLLALIANLRLLVSNDGGMLHLAVAEGLPTVSIFGPVDDLVYGPYPASKKHIVIKKDLSCRPCYKNFRFTGCLNDRQCTKDITVDEVFLAVQRLLN